MASKTYRTPEQFAREFRRDVNRLGEDVVSRYQGLNTIEAKKLLEAETPERSGELRGSYVTLVNQRIADPKAVKVNRRGNLDSGVGNKAAHFHSVDWGRRPQDTSSRKFKGGTARTLGSTQAPRGMTKPASEKLQNKGRQDRLRKKAIRHAESKLK